MVISSFLGLAAMAASRAGRMRGWSDGRTNYFLSFSRSPIAQHGRWDRMGWQMDEPKQLLHQKSVHSLVFLVVREIDRLKLINA